jgi:putative solute:sodium symporter small subunit
MESKTASNFWDKTRRLTMTLLGLWFVVTFGAVFFARELDRVNLFGWPLSFYMAAQGIMLVYLAIVVVYTIRMGRAERQLQQTGEHTHGE